MRILLVFSLLILIANISFSDHADEPLLWSPEGLTSFSYKLKIANVTDCVEAWSKGNILEKRGSVSGISRRRGGVVLVAYKDRIFDIRWDHDSKTYNCSEREFVSVDGAEQTKKQTKIIEPKIFTTQQIFCVEKAPFMGLMLQAMSLCKDGFTSYNEGTGKLQLLLQSEKRVQIDNLQLYFLREGYPSTEPVFYPIGINGVAEQTTIRTLTCKRTTTEELLKLNRGNTYSVSGKFNYLDERTISLEECSFEEQKPIKATSQKSTSKCENLCTFSWWDNATLADLKNELAKGVNVNAKVNAADETEGYYATPIHFVSWKGNAEMVKLMLEAGSEVNLLHESWTPLQWAAYGDADNQKIKILLNAGADPLIKNDEGKTALEYAEENDKFKGTLALETLRKATVKDIVEETDTDNSQENYCVSRPMLCAPDELCKIATFKMNGKIVWSKNKNHKKYVDAAKERKISCGVFK